MLRTLILVAAIVSFAAPASAWEPILFRNKTYVGYNPPVRFPSGVYGGYAGSSYYLSPHHYPTPMAIYQEKIYPSPFPGYHWADPTLFSTGPGAAVNAAYARDYGGITAAPPAPATTPTATPPVVLTGQVK